MAGHKKNGAVNKDHVSISREEFDALMALKEANADSVIASAQTTNRNHDLLTTCNAQARRLVEVDLTIQNYERTTTLQRIYIDLLREDHPRVGSMDDLSEFWRQWVHCTNSLVKAQPLSARAVAELTPDLFRSWSNWVRDSGRLNRSFAMVGTRAEVEGKQPASQAEVQDRIIDQLRSQTATQAARLHELEGEVEAYRKARR